MVVIKKAFFLLENGNKKVINCTALTKEEYKKKYKGRLFCINNCKARMCFTERNDGCKYFRTWKNESELHNKDCPYYSENDLIENKKKRKGKATSLSEDEIQRRFLEKYRRKDKTKKSEDNNKKITKRTKSDLIPKNEKDIISVLSDRNEFIDENGTVYLKTRSVSDLTVADIGKKVAVEGIVNNLQLGYDENSNIIYAYLNFYPYELNCSIGLNEAYIKSEDAGTMNNVKTYLKKVDRILENNKNKIKVSAYGEVQKKDKGGIKIVVFNPKELVIDYAPYTYDGILVSN